MAIKIAGVTVIDDSEQATFAALTVDGTSLLDGPVVINGSGLDADFRVEGNTDTNLILTDAGNDRVYIGTAATGGQKLNVGGGMEIDGNIISSTNWYLYSDAGGSGVRSGINFDGTNQAIYLLTGSLNRIIINADGNVGIGAAAGQTNLYVYGPKDVFDVGYALRSHFSIGGNGYSAYHFLNTSYYEILQNSASRGIRIRSTTSGGVILSAGATSWASASDIRLKKNLENIEDGLGVLDNVRCVTYQLNSDDDSAERRVGVVAQDLVGKADPVLTLSKEDPEGEEYYGVKYTELVPYLIKAIQQLNHKIQQLESAQTNGTL